MRKFVPTDDVRAIVKFVNADGYAELLVRRCSIIEVAAPRHPPGLRVQKGHLWFVR
jgi:hypothetical protein